jgi:hypothetical protein
MDKEDFGTKITYPKTTIKEAKKKYYEEHKLGFFARLKESSLLARDNAIISIEGKGYWLSDIIIENIKLKFDYIQEILIKDSKLMWTMDSNGDLITLFKTKKKLIEIKNKIKLPEYKFS